MRKFFAALGLAAALMVGTVAVDGTVISVTTPGGTEIAATVTTVDTAEARGRDCQFLRRRCAPRIGPRVGL